MAYITIDEERCKGCGLCERSCPKQIIKVSKQKTNLNGYFVAECVDNEKCIGCTFCAVMCPDTVIEVYK
jgi:2-oxoglutarate ferredoxin oxidoreductase subunit delta